MERKKLSIIRIKNLSASKNTNHKESEKTMQTEIKIFANHTSLRGPICTYTIYKENLNQFKNREKLNSHFSKEDTEVTKYMKRGPPHCLLRNCKTKPRDSISHSIGWLKLKC